MVTDGRTMTDLCWQTISTGNYTVSMIVISLMSLQPGGVRCNTGGSTDNTDGRAVTILVK